MKKIYIICSVRDATPETRAALEAYTDMLEEEGHMVHLPHRDTNQDASGLEICMENGAGILLSDEIHIFWDKGSFGSHFDLGMVFIMDMLVGKKKRICIMEMGETGRFTIDSSKSFQRLLIEWTEEQDRSGLYDTTIDNIIEEYKRK
jgi:hypothetical protein